MSDDQNIDGLVNDAFGSMEHKAPSGLWSSMSDEMAGDAAANSVDEAVKVSFDSSSEAAPAGIWAGVNRQLNIDTVWNGILSYLDRRRRWRLVWWRFGVPAGVLVLLLGIYGVSNWLMSSMELGPVNFTQSSWVNQVSANNGPIDQDSQTSEEKNKPDARSQEHQVETPGLLDEIPGADLVSPSPVVSPPVTPVFQNDGTRGGSEDADHDAEPTRQDLSRPEDPSAPPITNSPTQGIPIKGWVRPRHLDFMSVGSKPLSQVVSVLPVLQPVEPPTKERNWELGGYVSPLYAFLVNNDVRNGLDNNSLIELEHSLSWEYGLSAVKPLDGNQGLQFDLSMSHFRQEVAQYVEGNYFHKLSKFNIVSAYAGYRRLIGPADFNQKRTVLGAGIKLGYVLSERSLLVENGAESSMDLRKLNTSVDLWLGRTMERKGVDIEYGLRSTIGLFNLFGGSDPLPAKFDVSKTLGVGPYLSIRGALSPKK